MDIPLIYLVTLLGITAMLLASIPKRTFKYGLEMAWLLICVFLAIRYDFGNDYMGYQASFETLNSWGVFNVDKDSHADPGWQVLCYIFQPIGFFGMVAAITIFQCFIMYRFIKENVPERYYWFAIFIYVFNPSFMLIGASMMRQMLAITLFIWSITYIKRRKIIPYVILIFIASQIHFSAVILYPLFVLGYINDINIKSNKWINFIFIIVYIILSSASMQLAPIINDIATMLGEEDAVEYYIANAVYAEDGYGIGSVLQLFLFVLLVFKLNNLSPASKIFFMLLIFSTFVKPFALEIPMIARFSYYFDVFAIVCYPIIWGGEKVCSIQGRNISQIFHKNRFWDLAAIMIMVLLAIYEFNVFFKHPIWIDKFSTYQTIFTFL